MSKDNRWRYSPMPHEEGWLHLRREETQRREQDIIFELIQLGRDAFDKKYKLGAFKKRGKKTSTAA